MKTWWMAAALIAVGGVAHGDPLEDAAKKQALAQAAGAAQVGDFLKGDKEKTDFQVMLEAGKCYWFSTVSAGKVNKVATFLWAPGANLFTPRLTSERSESGAVTLAWCTKVPGMYKFQTKIEGKGNYVTAVYVKEGPPAAAVPDLGQYCDKDAAIAAKGAKRTGEFFEGSGNSIGRDDRQDYTIQMDNGKCYWMIACGEAGRDGEDGKIKALYLYLWGPDNKRITEAKSTSSNPMIGHCATLTGMYKLQAKINSGSGKYKLGVYVK
jgi:hypothetical protein